MCIHYNNLNKYIFYYYLMLKIKVIIYKSVIPRSSFVPLFLLETYKQKITI